MLVIGITGGFGTGKSSVAEILASYGVKIIDADKIVHRILSSNHKVYKKIIKTFGEKILNENSQKINRVKLGKIVFQNRVYLEKLCKIVHPEVIRKIKKDLGAIKKRKNECIVAIDAPLLIETGLLNLVDKLIVIKISRKNQIRRIKKKMNLSNAEIIERIKAQMPLRKKIKLADYVIDNNKNLSFTKKQLEEIYKRLIK